MKEVEIKIRNINKREIIKKIEELGAKKVFSGWVVDYRFDTPHRTLSRQGKSLRIRKKGRYIYLDLKGKKKTFEDLIDRDEQRVKIQNLSAIKKILFGLGYIKIFELSKYRIEYRMGDIVFDIDEYVGMEPILEIESHNVDNVNEYIKKLGIKKENVGRIYIREILAAKRRYEKEKAEKKEQKITKNKE